jgi:methionyl-tRNA synthetase
MPLVPSARRRRLRKRISGFLFFWKMIGGILLFPILIPIALMQHSWEEKQKKKIVEQTRCIRCGNYLGVNSMELADQKWEKYIQKRQKENPGVRFRTLRLVHAICVSCGTEYFFRENEKRFIHLPDFEQSAQ